jgi:hypothetical protein
MLVNSKTDTDIVQTQTSPELQIGIPYRASTEHERLVLDLDSADVWHSVELIADETLLHVVATEHTSKPTPDTIVHVNPDLIDEAFPDRLYGEAESLYEGMYRSDGTLNRVGSFFYSVGYRAEKVEDEPTFKIAVPRDNALEDAYAAINERAGEQVVTPNVRDLSVNAFTLRSFVEAARDHARPRATGIEMEIHDRHPFHSFSSALLFAEGTLTGERVAELAEGYLATNDSDLIEDFGFQLDFGTVFLSRDLAQELENEDDEPEQIIQKIKHTLEKTLNPDIDSIQALSEEQLIEAAEDIFRRANIVVNSVNPVQSLGGGVLAAAELHP